ncbi:hypothetical protein BHE90_003410 [Fusarium euwallaceae]|uniref:Uncharacterized protein n=1 Tax=Fusarium euwallaceae TaxID=1147111 RepID=A0A430M2E1_9HYPO|nr:hypothetical protein BHE90_003410 [Fusarium euwallaceae]
MSVSLLQMYLNSVQPKFQRYQRLVTLDASISFPIRLVSVFGEDLDKLVVFARVLQHAVYSEERLERFIADHEMCPPMPGTVTVQGLARPECRSFHPPVPKRLHYLELTEYCSPCPGDAFVSAITDYLGTFGIGYLALQSRKEYRKDATDTRYPGLNDQERPICGLTTIGELYAA